MEFSDPYKHFVVSKLANNLNQLERSLIEFPKISWNIEYYWNSIYFEPLAQLHFINHYQQFNLIWKHSEPKINKKIYRTFLAISDQKCRWSLRFYFFDAVWKHFSKNVHQPNFRFILFFWYFEISIFSSYSEQTNQNHSLNWLGNQAYHWRGEWMELKHGIPPFCWCFLSAVVIR